MQKIIKKSGISLVALVITIIVLVILTGTVIMNGVNVPKQGQLAVFKNNVTIIQEAVTMKMLNNMIEYASLNSENVKWIGVAQGYKEDSISNSPIFNENINEVDVIGIDESIKEMVSISNEEFAKYYVDAKGKVYHRGFEYEGVIYYNLDMQEVGELPDKEVSSIALVKDPNKIEYVVGEKVDITGLEVVATYEDGTTENVERECTFRPSLTEATSEVGNTQIEISYQGKKAADKINITVKRGQPTLGSIIEGPDDYGKTINYTVSIEGLEFSDWEIYYEDVENGYVFIRYAEPMEFGIVNQPSLDIDEELYKIFKLGQDGYALKENSNSSMLVANSFTNEFQIIANKNVYIDNNGESYVVGAIASPTLEMVVAGYEEKTGVSLNLQATEAGYIINGTNCLRIEGDGFFIPNDYVLMLSSVGHFESYDEYAFIINGSGVLGLALIASGGMTGDGQELPNAPIVMQPIICLKSNMPAHIKEAGDTAETDIVIDMLESVEITSEPTKKTYAHGEDFDVTGMKVIATYKDGSKKDVTDICEYSPKLEEVTKLAGEYSIEVKFGGITTSKTVDITVTHLEKIQDIALINYGEKINYVANGKEDWEIYYKDTVNGQEYIYLIASTSIGQEGWFDGIPPESEVEKANASSLYNIMKLGQTGYTLNKDYVSSRCVADLVNNYGEYANTTDYIDGNGESYVIGAIGSPTLELVAARANAILPNAMVLGTAQYGYTINGGYNGHRQTGLPVTDFFDSIVLTSPTYKYSDWVQTAYSEFFTIGSIDLEYKTIDHDLCPIVCIRGDIPATWDGEKWNINK